MQHLKTLMKISGSGFDPRPTALVILLLLSLSGTVGLKGQDTLRTYGPRVGFDLAKVAWLFLDPPQRGLELSLDAEVAENIYPVFELGYNSGNITYESYDYSSQGVYARLGADYNLLPLKDRSTHHSISIGFRYALALFEHEATEILITNDLWGDLPAQSYASSPTAHWGELVLGMKAELFPNLFLGWSLRYKILFNRNLDPVMRPDLLPGFGSAMKDSSFGFTYSIFYKIPILKK